MPADRRATFPAVKPVKTERTHEENQERAYIAASRRSDRSLEARIESARRASEIHKKRTGRALRVTEQDVVNEEMYEEEDDDLPTQYQRLNAHLQTSSWLFNRKLHDYIATQHGVRNMFLQQQFPGHNLQSFGVPGQPSGQMPNMNQGMLPPQQFNSSTQGFAQPSHTFSPQVYQPPQQQSYRHAPYNIQQRPNAHQRSSSMSVSQETTVPVQPSGTDATTPTGGVSRRLSLPPHLLEKQAQQAGSTQQRPSLPCTATAQNQQQSSSPQRGAIATTSSTSSGNATPTKSEHTSPTKFQFPSLPFDSQVIDLNPISLSLPPESQQFVGTSLDPNDPRTSIFMSGSDNLPQPFTGTYTYNPNLSPKAGRSSNATDTLGMTQTLAPAQSMKLDSADDTPTSTSPPSAATENIYTPQSLFTPTGFEYTNFFDSYQPAGDSLLNEPFEDNSFVNWDQ